MIAIVASVVLGAVFIFAGISKIRTPAWAIMAIDGGTPRPLVIALPVFEALLGLALVLHVLPSVMPWVAGVVLIAFTATLAYRYKSGSKAPCNCFGGKSNDPVGPIDIGRNVLLLVLVAIALT